MILLLVRIKNQEEGTLCREVYEEGKTNDWPGLGQDVANICRNLGIPDVNNVMMSKQDIKKAIFENHYEDMVNTIKTKSKLDEIKDDDFKEVQPYFHEKSIEKTRMIFKMRTHMVPKIPGNFKNKYRVKGKVSEGLTCTLCTQGELFTQSHCVTCPAWSDVRQGLDMTNIDDLVVFFRKLLLERAKVC